jgi:small conductance mechanosensitive channel
MDKELLDFAERTSQQLLAYGLDVIGAILLLVAGWIVAGFARRRLQHLFRRTGRIDETLAPFLTNVVRYAILAIVLVLVLGQFGVQTASIIAVLGAAGLALGLALQGTLQNVAAGLMLLFIRPFKVGDYIEAGGGAGTVDEINLFVTEMHTFDGVYLAVPNADIWNSAIKNYSRLPTRMLEVEVGIAYDDDIDRALTMLQDLMTADARVLKDPAPQVMVAALADSAVNLKMRCWASIDDYWDLVWDLNKRIKEVVEAAGMTIPFPQRDVHLFRADTGGKAAGLGR